MNIKETLGNLKEKITSLFKRLVNFIKEDLRRSLIILLIALIVLLIILVISSVVKGSSKRLDETISPITFSQELLIPEGPQVKQDYSVSRQPEEQWPEAETENWFTVPSSKEVEDLGRANDKLILDVIGAAP